MLSQEEQWLLSEKYGGEKSEAFFTACKQLESGTPLAYLIGHVPFLNCKIYLNSKPLIPRPETEFWVEQAIKEIKEHQNTNPSSVVKILDLCAGSGCMGVAIAKNIENIKVDFIEYDQTHLPTIEKNCLENNIAPENFRIMKGDLFSPLTTETYNFILSNPPYIDPILDRAEASVKDHEPHLALYGGKQGIELIAKIIETAPKHLSPNGQLWLEHEPEQVDSIKELAKTNFRSFTHTDQYNVPRFTKLVLQ